MSVSRRKFLTGLGAVISMSSTPIVMGELSSHFNTLKVKQYDLPTAKVPEGFDVVIAFIADLHVGCPSVPLEKVPEIVHQVNNLTYKMDDKTELPVDMIGIGGDVLLNKHYDPRTIFVRPEEIAPLLGELKAPLGVVMVGGNHDWDRLAGLCGRHYSELDKNAWKMFEENKIHVLENEKIKLQKNDIAFDVIGLPDFTTRWHCFNENIFQDAEKRPAIVLSHDPMSVKWLDPAVVAQLSGHTHGGQYTVPFVGAIYSHTPHTPQEFLYDHVRWNGVDMYVSSGIGTSTVPFKNTPCEIVLLRVRHQGPVTQAGINYSL